LFVEAATTVVVDEELVDAPVEDAPGADVIGATVPLVDAPSEVFAVLFAVVPPAIVVSGPAGTVTSLCPPEEELPARTVVVGPGTDVVTAVPCGATVVAGLVVVLVDAAVVVVVEATVVVVVVVVVVVGGAVVVVVVDVVVVVEVVGGEYEPLTQAAAPAPPEQACHPALEVHDVLPLANSGFARICAVPEPVVCSRVIESITVP
jgi:hypothetical protein